MVTDVDLVHLGLPGAICTYWIDGEEPALVDPGPFTSLDNLRSGLEATGRSLADLRHVLLTHVHLDHAGVTGHLLRENPRLTVHVHEDGAPHMADPARLVASTRRTFGDLHDELWGEVVPVPADRIRAWRPGERLPLRRVRAFATPGHADHHVSFLDEDSGFFLAGDALGIVLAPESPTFPPTPPPGVDIEAWRRTLAEIEGIGAERAGMAHFGLHHDVTDRALQLRERLDALLARVERAVAAGEVDLDAERYAAELEEEQADFRQSDQVELYMRVFTPKTDYAGVVRYVRKRAESGGR